MWDPLGLLEIPERLGLPGLPVQQGILALLALLEQLAIRGQQALLAQPVPLARRVLTVQS
jgi:hypothetical protein